MIQFLNGMLGADTTGTLSEHANMKATITQQFLSPPKVGTLLGVGVHKVAYWIAAGELEAVNLASDATKRPRWGVSLEAIERFKSRRMAVQPSKTTTRRPRSPFTSRKYF